MAESGVDAVLLAAGGSRRLGQPKQLLSWRGEPLLRRMARIALASGVDRVHVALGARADLCAAVLADLPVQIHVIGDWASGMGRTLAGMIERLPTARGWLVLGVDQLGLSGDHLKALLERFQCDPERPVASAYAGVIGIPAVFPTGWRARLLALHGDQGARQCLREAYPPPAHIESAALADDIDDAHDWQLAGAGMENPDET